MTRRRCHWVSPSRRGDKRTPLGALRRSWGHREQLEDFPGEVGAPRHRVTPQSWGRPRSVTPQSWGRLCVTPMVSDPKAGDTPQCHTPKLGTPRQCHISKLGQLCPPDGVRPQSWGRPHSVTAQSWGLSQRWECPHIPTMASHPKVGDPLWGPIQCVPHCRPHCSHGVGAGSTLYFWD